MIHHGNLEGIYGTLDLVDVGHSSKIPVFNERYCVNKIKQCLEEYKDEESFRIRKNKRFVTRAVPQEHPRWYNHLSSIVTRRIQRVLSVSRLPVYPR